MCPIFDYCCDKCGLVEERMVKINEESSAMCLSCKQPMKKMISAPAVHLDNSFPGQAIKNGK